MPELDLTVSIVSYNTADYLQRCLASMYQNTEGISFQVIVVDNASQDGSSDLVRQKFPQAVLIENGENRFFTAAHNQALAVAQGRHFLILNSDTEVPAGTLARLVAFLDCNPAVGAVGCREVNPQGTTHPTGSTFSSPWLEMLERTALATVYRLRGPHLRYRMTDWDRLSSRDLDVITDCFIMVRRDLMKQLGGYDERFLLYYTENDLCLRIWQSGYRVHFLSDCSYLHHGQRSTVQIGADGYNRIYEQDMINYYRKHFGEIRTKLMQAGFLLAQNGVAPVLSLYRRLRFGPKNSFAQWQ